MAAPAAMYEKAAAAPGAKAELAAGPAGGGAAAPGGGPAPEAPPPPPAPVPPAAARAETETVRYLSADDSNSMASPVIARKLIQARALGAAGPGAHLRVPQLLHLRLRPARRGADGEAAPIAIEPQMRPVPTGGRPQREPVADGTEYSLQVAVRSLDRELAALPPLRLTVLLDVSGSMAGAPLDLARVFLQGLARRLRPGDRLSLLACNRRVEIAPGRPRGGRRDRGEAGGPARRA